MHFLYLIFYNKTQFFIFMYFNSEFYFFTETFVAKKLFKVLMSICQNNEIILKLQTLFYENTYKYKYKLNLQMLSTVKN